MGDTFYTPEHISRTMSLRKPQTASLNVLDKILNNISSLSTLEEKLNTVKNLYPTCTDFEREFMSITFALATGVGKTRLMGAFIAYLYTNHNVRNFFVTAPNTTIYEKLRRDLSDTSNPKYVFKGLGCFEIPPQIYTEDDYRTRIITISEAIGIRIFVYNIDKFNREDAKMRQANEIIGESFYNYLSSLNDLVLIMDESHHYRAERGAAALNELKPALGLELTAIPIVNKGSKQIPFKNVVYEYKLSQAIADGYTRTPFAATRADINFYNFGEEQLDKLMLNDGAELHEHAKKNLRAYALSNNKKLVKPFMLVVCKDTAHAEWVEKYIRSDEFKNGKYKNKTLVIHSKQKGAESEGNTRLLLGVEEPANPIEIVIHVNMLKEGWDVNNLYTIVPLRTASSKILREQMVGRGLRLPYGERTGNESVDAVMLTAHDKFQEIIEEAQRGDSIFKAGNVIKIGKLQETEVPQITFGFEDTAAHDTPQEIFQEKLEEVIQQAVSDTFVRPLNDAQNKERVIKRVVKEISENKSLADLAKTYEDNVMPLSSWIHEKVEKTYQKAKDHFIPIPQIKITEAGADDYGFDDFELDLSAFNHTPVGDPNLLIQSLLDPEDRKFIKGNVIDFEAINPTRVILNELCKKPEIDYGKFSGLILKLIQDLLDHYDNHYGFNGSRNIVMMNKHDISNEIYKQMLQHAYRKNGFLQEEIIGNRDHNLRPNYKYKQTANLFESFSGNISSILFTGIKKGVFASAKFDSYQGELTLARVIEKDGDVQNWLRPAPLEFDITYNNGRRYEPDFVIETEKVIYLTEVKGEDRMNDPDTIAKKERGISYCDIASRWGRANGFKDWRYLFIPAGEIRASSTFKMLVQRFVK